MDDYLEILKCYTQVYALKVDLPTPKGGIQLRNPNPFIKYKKENRSLSKYLGLH